MYLDCSLSGPRARFWELMISAEKIFRRDLAFTNDFEEMRDKVPVGLACPGEKCGGIIEANGVCPRCGLDMKDCAEWLEYVAMSLDGDEEGEEKSEDEK